MKTVVAKKYKLEQFEEGLQFYLKNMSEGKVLFEPWSEWLNWHDLSLITL